MHAHDHDVDAPESLRPKGARLDDPERAWPPGPRRRASGMRSARPGWPTCNARWATRVSPPRCRTRNARRCTTSCPRAAGRSTPRCAPTWRGGSGTTSATCGCTTTAAAHDSAVAVNANAYTVGSEHRLPARPLRPLLHRRPADARARADPRRPAAQRPGGRDAGRRRDQGQRPVRPVRAGGLGERRAGDVGARPRPLAVPPARRCSASDDGREDVSARSVQREGEEEEEGAGQLHRCRRAAGGRGGGRAHSGLIAIGQPSLRHVHLPTDGGHYRTGPLPDALLATEMCAEMSEMAVLRRKQQMRSSRRCSAARWDRARNRDPAGDQYAFRRCNRRFGARQGCCRRVGVPRPQRLEVIGYPRDPSWPSRRFAIDRSVIRRSVLDELDDQARMGQRLRHVLRVAVVGVVEEHDGAVLRLDTEPPNQVGDAMLEDPPVGRQVDDVACLDIGRRRSPVTPARCPRTAPNRRVVRLRFFMSATSSLARSTSAESKTLRACQMPSTDIAVTPGEKGTGIPPCG